MVAGCLASCGYFMGPHLHRATESNPKGFFESRAVNRLNDALIRPVVPTRPPLFGRWTHPRRLGRTHMWLARLPIDAAALSCSDRQRAKMRALVAHRPIAFKDPRFSYTLPLWRPVLGDAAFVCVFRQPAATARSLRKELTRPRYAGLELDDEAALDLYACMYEPILRVHRHDGDWLFLHFDQVIEGDGLERLGRFLEADVDRTFPEARLRRSPAGACEAPRANEAYAELCDLAGVSPP